MAASSDPSATITTAPVTDPFEQLLNLEETFYQQGYQLGHQDGAQQGLVEGRIFGMERGFDKFFEMARLHGHSVILGNQIPAVMNLQTELKPIAPKQKPGLTLDPGVEVDLDLTETELQPLSGTGRLEKHIRTLYALTEPASLSLQNSEDDISEFDDRFKRAQAKATILSKMTGYDLGVESRDVGNTGSGEGNETEGGKSHGQSREASIEDVSILKARH